MATSVVQMRYTASRRIATLIILVRDLGTRDRDGARDKGIVVQLRVVIDDDAVLAQHAKIDSVLATPGTDAGRTDWAGGRIDGAHVVQMDAQAGHSLPPLALIGVVRRSPKASTLGSSTQTSPKITSTSRPSSAVGTAKSASEGGFCDCGLGRIATLIAMARMRTKT